MTVLAFAPPEPEEQQWEPPQGGAEEEEDLPECPDHHPSTYVEGMPRSIIRLLLFFVIMSSCQLTMVMYSYIKCKALI